MATIKSYTDISQSKVLAEILPIESADMFRYGDAVTKETNPRIMNYMQVPELQSMYYSPCWSLVALLNVIKKQGLVDLQFFCSTFDNRGNHLTNVWCCTFETLGTVTLSLYADKSVDACYDMILKLHELNLL